MASAVNIGFVDHSGERSATRVYLTQMDDTNFNLVAGNSVLGQAVFDLRAAISAITLCNLTGVSVMAVDYPETDVNPASVWAQRELGLRVFYTDTVNGKKYHITIPGPDLVKLAELGTDNVDPQDADWLAFVAAFELHARSPDGNAVEITAGRIVGRPS